MNGDEHLPQTQEQYTRSSKRGIAVFLILGALIVSFLTWAAWFLFTGRFNEFIRVFGKQTDVSPTQEAFRSIPQQFIGDQDLDTLSDEDEKKIGTSDFEYDTDGDSIPDADERTVWNTDPTNADTDGDGFQDGVEIIQGFNPLVSATKKD